MQFFRGVPIQSGFSPTAETSARPAETVARRRGTRVRKVAELTPRILHVTAELWPYAWSGGLGHAVADLADQQALNSRDVTVVTPWYAAASSTAGQVWPACEPFRVHHAGAIVAFRNPGEHAERMVRAMGRDFSWQRPLAQYDEVYRRAMAAR